MAKHPMLTMALAGSVFVGVVMGFLMTVLVAVAVSSAAAAMSSIEAAATSEVKRMETMMAEGWIRGGRDLRWQVARLLCQQTRTVGRQW